MIKKQISFKFNRLAVSFHFNLISLTQFIARLSSNKTHQPNQRQIIIEQQDQNYDA